MKHILLLTILLQFTSRTIQCQSLSENTSIKTEFTLKGIGKLYNDKISLRWNISDANKMNYLAKTGVVIDRVIIDQNNMPESDWQRITKQPIAAMTSEALTATEFKQDTGYAAIYNCLYKPTNFPKVNELENIQNQQMDVQNRYFILSLFAAQSPRTAIAAGLGYEDKIVGDSTKSYVYRITMSDNDKNVGVAFVYIYGKTLGSNHSITDLIARGNDKSITLKWNVKKSMATGYWIERSTNGLPYTRLNRVLYIPTIDTASNYAYYADSVANYIKYQYRISGLNSFGEYINSNITELTNASDQTAPEAPILTAEKKNNSIHIQWRNGRDNDIKGYYLLYGPKPNNTDSLVVKYMIPAKTLTYEMKMPAGFKNAYYRVMVLDTANNYSFSNTSYVFESDQIPPEPPTDLIGTIDSAGVVVLSWALDTQDAIIGYKVFFANQEDHEYVAISNILEENRIVDTINLRTHSKSIFYKVVAVDQNYNHSKLSYALEIKRPDIIPPVEPVILDYTVSQNNVKLSWSPVIIEDISHYIVYKRFAGETKWLQDDTTQNAEYLFTNLSEFTNYEFTVQAVDNSQLKSKYAFALAIKTGRKIKTEKPNIQKIEKEVNGIKTYTLAWDASKYETRVVIIYKQVDGNFITFASVEGQVNSYNILAKDSKTPYAIRYMYKDGTESDLME